VLKLSFAALFGLFCLAHPTDAAANPSLGRPESIITEIRLGDSSFSLSTDRPAIPTDGSYSYVVEITPGADLLSVNLHFQLMREEDGWAFHYFGDSIYIEREPNDNEVAEAVQTTPAPDFLPEDTAAIQGETEVIRHVLERRSADNLDGLGMREGVYYVAVIVTANTAAGSESATLRDILVVYDSDQPELKLMPVVQISALPSRDAQGNFLSSPARGVFEERRATLEALCLWVSNNPHAQMSLAVSPLFLEELDAVSQGFSYHVPYTGTSNGEANGTNGTHGANGTGATTTNTSNANDDDTTAATDDTNDQATETDTENTSTSTDPNNPDNTPAADAPNTELRQLTAESETARASLRTLEALQAAHATGRLSISAQGYSDPNYSVLDILDLADDLPAHYQLGQSTLYDLLGIEAASLSVPWTTQLSDSYIETIVDLLPQPTHPEQNLPRIIVDSNIGGFHFPTIWTERSEDRPFVLEDASVIFGSDRVDVIVADAALSRALSSEGSRAQYIHDLFEARQNTPLLPLLVRAHDDMDSVTKLLENLELMAQYSWVSLHHGEADIDAQSAPLLFSAPPGPPQSIPNSVIELQASRFALAGLAEAIYEFDPEHVEEFVHYYHLSLALFAGPSIELGRTSTGPSDMGGSTSTNPGSGTGTAAPTATSAAFTEFTLSSPALECLALARDVQAYADNWFEGIEIHVQPMTFSGSGGILPITVVNDSDQTFYLTLRYETPGQNLLISPSYTYQEFLTGETFLEPSVELRNIVSGSVTIELWASNHLIAEESVRVSATYADRIAIIVVVVLAGTLLAFYVWKRVRSQAAQAQQPAPAAQTQLAQEGQSQDEPEPTPQLQEGL